MRYLHGLPPIQQRVLAAVRDVAANRRVTPYLVGGPVRDLELGRPVLDLDLALETGVDQFARALALMLGGTVRSFPQFLTFKIVGDDLPETDVATTRRETYRFPGALPDIHPAALRDDLGRRDFTINAMALDVVHDTLVDPHGGAADLDARLLRVLHAASFTDDPTRIYRALRLAARLGFDIESGTSALIIEALAAGALDTVSRERLWREIFLAIAEEEAGRILFRLAESGSLTPFLGVRPDGELRMLGGIDELIREDTVADREVVYLSALLRCSPDPMTAMEGASLSRRRRMHVLEIIQDMEGFIRNMDLAGTDAGRLALFREASSEMVMCAAACSALVRDLRGRFEAVSALDIGVRGNDLGVPPGKHIALALERTREALFFGEITQHEAVAFARFVALQYLKSDESQNGIDEAT